MSQSLWKYLTCICLVLITAGCNRSSDAETDAPKKKTKNKDKSISPLAGKLGTFDDGRIEVPLPKNWDKSVDEEAADNDPNKNLARMNTGSQRAPGILIKVREYPEFKTLGPSDLRKFARKRADELMKERNSKTKFNVKEKSIKNFHGCEYSYGVKISSQSFDRLTLETVVDGRLYTLELFTVKGLREESRPDLYAVAAGLKFPKMINKPSRGRSVEDEEEATDEETEDADGEKATKGDEEMSDEEAE